MICSELINKLNSLAPTELGIVYLGQAGFLFSFGGTNILVDPYLSYSVDRSAEKGDGRWTRLYAPPFTCEELSFVDYVFISHDHLDHADPQTLGELSRFSKAQFVCPSAISEKIAQYTSKSVIAMKCASPLECFTFSVKAVPSAHEEIHLDSCGEPFECGFLFDFCGIYLYHSGDSLVYDGLEAALSGTDIMLLPVNGNGFFRKKDDLVGNMDAFDACRLAKSCNARLLIPMHYDLYKGNFVPQDAVRAIISEEAPDLNVRYPKPGEGYTIRSRNTKLYVEAL